MADDNILVRAALAKLELAEIYLEDGARHTALLYIHSACTLLSISLGSARQAKETAR